MNVSYKIIAIEREYASGGREIGEKVAKALGVKHYGREILEIVAQNRGTTAEKLAHLEETVTTSMIFSLRMMNSTLSAEDDLPPAEELMMAEESVIKELATKEESCVFVGRSAGIILEDRDDVLRVFVHADAGFRTKRARDYYGVKQEQIPDMIKKMDRRRANFHSTYFKRSWDNRSGYHMVLNSGLLTIDGCVDAIVACMSK